MRKLCKYQLAHYHFKNLERKSTKSEEKHILGPFWLYVSFLSVSQTDSCPLLLVAATVALNSSHLFHFSAYDFYFYVLNRPLIFPIRSILSVSVYSCVCQDASLPIEQLELLSCLDSAWSWKHSPEIWVHAEEIASRIMGLLASHYCWVFFFL